MVPSRSPTGGTFLRQFVSGIQHEGSETLCSCFVYHACRYALCRMVPSPSVTYTRLRSPSHMTSQESMGCVLLHHASHIASARIRESCRLLHASKESHFIMPRGEQSEILRPAMFLPRLQLPSSHRSHVFLLISLTSTKPPFHIRGVACSHETREGGASVRSTRLASF